MFFVACPAWHAALNALQVVLLPEVECCPCWFGVQIAMVATAISQSCHPRASSVMLMSSKGTTAETPATQLGSRCTLPTPIEKVAGCRTRVADVEGRTADFRN
jgi:hypothetical protein